MNAMTLIAKRIGIAMLTLLLVSIVVFSITALLPGDAAQAALGQSLGVIDRRQQRGVAIDTEFLVALSAGRHHRAAAGHRLGGGESEAFVGAG